LICSLEQFSLSYFLLSSITSSSCWNRMFVMKQNFLIVCGLSNFKIYYDICMNLYAIFHIKGINETVVCVFQFILLLNIKCYHYSPYLLLNNCFCNKYVDQFTIFKHISWKVPENSVKFHIHQILYELHRGRKIHI
jgi:hypothetical protein